MNIAGGCLIVSFKERSSEQASLEYQREIFQESIRRDIQGIILDVSGISLMDSFMSKGLLRICKAALILGKMTVIVGLKPAVVASLVDLEVDLSGVRTAVNVDQAIELINPPIMASEPQEPEESDSEDDVDIEEAEENENDDEAFSDEKALAE